MTDICIVKPSFRRLDTKAAAPLRAMMAAAWAGGPRIVALDLTDVMYVDSLGLSALVAENRQRPTPGAIVVFGLTEYVREVFEISRLAELFDVFETAAAVRAALGDADAARAV
ncbi:MAG TPA: STAS domain-containing protein [Byssovorax sp.]|jgi:anti-anti-sigma factor